MPPKVTLPAIIEQFNHGVKAFDRALAACRAGNLAEYEVGIRAAAVAGVSSLEWAIRVHFAGVCKNVLSPKERGELNDMQFDTLVGLVGRARPPVDGAREARFRQHRIVRNHGEHHSAIPAHACVLDAFVDIRRFLVQNLAIAEEKLAVADATGIGKAVDNSAERGTGNGTGHRANDPTTWAKQDVAKGIAGLRRSRAAAYDATVESLALEASGLLTRDAQALCDAGLAPDAVVPNLTVAVEEEIKLMLRDGIPKDGQRLERLTGLILRRAALCVEAGWLKATDTGVVFADPITPQLLMGIWVAQLGAAGSDRMRVVLSAQRAWSESAWAATRLGDDLDSWAQLVLRAPAGEVLVGRVVAACAAFGGAGPTAHLSETGLRAFRACAAALVLLAPQRVDTFDRPIEPDSPWFLAPQRWQRCVLDLAHAASIWASEPRLLCTADVLADAPPALIQLAAALGMTGRVPADEAATMWAMCSPVQAAHHGDLEGPFVARLFGHNRGHLGSTEFLQAWFADFGIAAHWRASPERAARLFATPGDGHFAGFLLNRPELIGEWSRAWSHLVRSAEPNVLVETWLGAIKFVAEREDDATRQAIRAAHGQLLAAGLGAEVRVGLLAAMADQLLVPSADKTSSSVIVDVLRAAQLSEDEWKAAVITWTAMPALAWKTLLEAGAPDAAIAEWAVAKLVAQQQAPAAYRNGPVGIIAGEGMEILATDGWQLAFQQATEALRWLLACGSEAAIRVLADACFPVDPKTPGFDLSLGKMAGNLDVVLSQVIWGTVIARPAGRSSLFAHVERGRTLCGVHFLGNTGLGGGESNLWVAVAKRLAEEALPSTKAAAPQPVGVAQRGATQKAVAAEAQRLLACFELQVSRDPWIANINGQAIRHLVIALVARCGAEVAGPLHELLAEAAATAALDRDRSSLLGIGIAHYSQHHPGGAVAVLDAAADPAVLLAMCNDYAIEFWTKMLRHHGTAKVMAQLDLMVPPDVGLGLFDALATADHPHLVRRQSSPQFRRVVLLRSVGGAFAASPDFWRAAWAMSPPKDLAMELQRLPVGVWLTELLVESQRWDAEGRTSLLRQLAFYSSDQTVRTRCLGALLANPADRVINGAEVSEAS